MDAGTRIRKERERRGWTQEELAKKCGYKYKSSISKIEASGDDISSKKLKLIASVLGVSVGELMGWTETYTKTRESFERNYDAVMASKDSEQGLPGAIGILFSSVPGATEEELLQTASFLNYLKSTRKE